MSVIEKLDSVLAKFDANSLCNESFLAASATFLRDHGPAIRQALLDAERIKRDIEELYDVMPMLPITAETMDAATDWFTRYCIDFYREINAVQDAAIDARLASDSEGGE